MESDNGSADGLALRDNVVLRLAFYYAAVFSFFAGLATLFPSIVEYLTIERLRMATGAQDLLGAGGGEGGVPIDTLFATEAILRPDRTVPVLVSMLGALALALPIAWVYTWTRPHEKTTKAVAQALVVLPIAIAFVVFLVKGSLALAFSLAGIVAAVRFRTSLSDPGDAVFLFVGIGIGLAAGVQLLSVAFIASVFFTTAALTVWGTRFAENPARLEGFRLFRVDAGAPDPIPAAGTPRASERIDQEPSETVFFVHSTDPGQAETLANLVFGRYAREWRLNRIADGEGESRLLEFSVHLKKRTEPSTVVNAIRESGGSPIVRVDVASW